MRLAQVSEVPEQLYRLLVRQAEKTAAERRSGKPPPSTERRPSVSPIRSGSSARTAIGEYRDASAALEGALTRNRATELSAQMAEAEVLAPELFVPKVMNAVCKLAPLWQPMRKEAVRQGIRLP